MKEDKDSKLVSKLFTLGRHRKISVILILQHAFPKSKFNNEISRNAMYMELFRSPADQEQRKRVGQRRFPNSNDQFMDIFRGVTDKAYGHIFIDNNPETLAVHQVLINVFGETLRYNIAGALKVIWVQYSIHDEKNNTLMTPPPPLPIDLPLASFLPWSLNVNKRKKDKREITKIKKRNKYNTQQPIPIIRRTGVGWQRT